MPLPLLPLLPPGGGSWNPFRVIADCIIRCRQENTKRQQAWQEWSLRREAARQSWALRLLQQIPDDSGRADYAKGLLSGSFPATTGDRARRHRYGPTRPRRTRHGGLPMRIDDD